MLVNRTFTAWDYAVFCSTLVISSGVGIFYAFAGGGQKTTAEIFLGDRKMSAFPVAGSLLASFMSAVTLLGLAAETYNFGWEYWQICIAFIFVIFAANHLYIPVFYHYKLTSTFEYLEKRFHKVVRMIGSLTFVLQMIFYMGIVLYAPSLALNAVTGFSITASILSIGLVCTFYTTVGGMKAVIWTDTIQIFFMFAGILAVIILGTLKVGGVSVVFQRALQGGRIYAFNYNPNPFIRHTFWTCWVGGFFMWLSIFGVNQAQVQRCLSCSSLKTAKRAMYVSLPGLIALMTVCVTAGLVLYANYFDCDPIASKHITSSDQLLPFAVMDLMYYPGVPGLFIASLFSGSLSTMSSGLNSIAAVIIEDVIRTYVGKIPEAKASLYSKIIAALFGFVLIAMAFLSSLMGTILQAALTIFGVVGGPLLGLFTLGMFFPWANYKGGLTGWLCGIAITIWLGAGSILFKTNEVKLPVSIAGCSNLTNFTSNLASSTNGYRSRKTFAALDMALSSNKTGFSPPAGSPYALYVYRLSYLHLSLVSIVVVLSVGLLVSYFTGFQDPDELDPELISPPVRKLYRWLAQKYGWKWLTRSPVFLALDDNELKVEYRLNGYPYHSASPTKTNRASNGFKETCLSESNSFNSTCAYNPRDVITPYGMQNNASNVDGVVNKGFNFNIAT